MTTWKPDLAFISWQSQSKRSGGSGLALRCSESYDESHWRTQTFGPIPDHKVTNIRPLVVIDPESAGDLALLIDYLDATGSPSLRRADLAAALREFAAPTPPKPAEPTGLGAVVEDAAGRKWIRAFGDVGYHVWHSERIDTAPQQWHSVDAVRVLSEGVTP